MIRSSDHYSRWLRAAGSQDPGLFVGNDGVEADAANLSMEGFQLSNPIHPSYDLARSIKVVNSLPEGLSSTYMLRKPLIVELERVSKEYVVASFLESDSHMAGNDERDAINELLGWMSEEYEGIVNSTQDDLDFRSLKKRAALSEYLSKIDTDA